MAFLLECGNDLLVVMVYHTQNFGLMVGHIVS
jgi:hypothetical protein